MPEYIPTWLKPIEELPSVKATELVKDRGRTYGDPTPIGITTCALWNAWLAIPGATDPDGVIRMIDHVDDYSIMLALHKLARERHNLNSSYPDNVDDVAGYMNVFRMIQRGDK